MLICPQCGNRPFANKEALLQHMKTSSAWHPFCAACDRRFSSKDAFTAHMNDKHPPTFDCTSCNRQFQAPYALEDHYRGSQLHPNCVRCGRGFKDAAACEEHHLTAHPKTPCIPCGGILLYEDTLEQHYKDSGNHPSCTECDRGFKDNSAYNEHFASSHPDRYCATCHIHFASRETLQSHALDAHRILPSPPPPAEPIEPTQEIDLYLDGKEKTAESSPTVPVHVPVSIPTTQSPPQETKAITDLSIYSTGFTPLSAIAGDPMRALIVGERRNHPGSPDLRLELANMAYTSPLTEVKPLFSPTAPSPLPRPGGSIERFWTSRENQNITTSRQPLTPNLKIQQEIPSGVEYLPPAYRNFEYVPYSLRNADCPPAPPPPRPYRLNVADAASGSGSGSGSSASVSVSVSVPSTSWLELPVGQQRSDALSLVQRRISPPQISPPLVSLSPPYISAKTTGLMTEFSSRLYPGSVRQAMRASANGNGGGGGSGSLVSRRTDGGSTAAASSSGSGSYELSFPFNRGLGVPLSMDEHLTKIRGQGSHRSFTDRDSASQSSSSLGLSRGGRGRSLDWPETSLFSETLTLVQTPTPKLEVPGNSNSNTPSQAYDYLGIHPTSPSLATFSSPASSTSVHHEDQPDTRPTTASSTPPALHAITYTITPSSECPSPRSPEVTSPVGLGALPTISPLAATPIDLYDFDFPEARKPLPESPVAQSPVTVVLDVPVPVEPEPEHKSPQVVVGERSPVAVEKLPESYFPPSTTIPLSTTTTTTTATATTTPTSPTIDFEPIFNVSVPRVMNPSPIPHTPIPLSATRSNRSTGTNASAASASALHPNPLHCRVCLADTCDDITASMCGHIFCNRCITDAVIKTNRCPVCMTPTLLYCLFRLDLAA